MGGAPVGFTRRDDDAVLALADFCNFPQMQQSGRCSRDDSSSSRAAATSATNLDVSSLWIAEQTPLAGIVSIQRSARVPPSAGRAGEGEVINLGYLSSVASDQIGDDAILGCPVPERARSILLAVDDHYQPVLGRRCGLGWLLRDATRALPVGHTPVAVRATLEQLSSEEFAELRRGAYQGSEIALYSSYHITVPAADPALTNE